MPSPKLSCGGSCLFHSFGGAFPSFYFPPKCASQNEEVVQWLEFPPSLRRARAQCIRITRIHYRPAPLVDFAALYFIALYSALKGGLVCQNNPTIPSGRAYITAKISQSDGAAAVIKAWLFCKDFGHHWWQIVDSPDTLLSTSFKPNKKVKLVFRADAWQPRG